jgi:hypothetical protein
MVDMMELRKFLELEELLSRSRNPWPKSENISLA